VGVSLSVIIPVFGDRRLSRCLEAILAQCDGCGGCEILVVGDGRNDRIRELVAGYRARYLEQPKLGPYAARNVGVAAATGDVLAFTDADCRPAPDWLSVIRSVFMLDLSDVAVGPSRALNRDPVGLLVQAVDDDRWRRLAREREVIYCDTRNLAVRREVCAAVPFDATFRNGGDLEWGIRASRLGYRIRYVPEMVVGHENVASLTGVWRRGIRRGRGLAQIDAKHGRGIRISGSRSLEVGGVDVKALLRSMAGRRKLRPLMTVALAGMTGTLLALLALALKVPGLDSHVRRQFELLDRMSLLLGLVLGPAGPV
jgi:glycosyltransferase involved in cell wall biosynthesis